MDPNFWKKLDLFFFGLFPYKTSWVGDFIHYGCHDMVLKGNLFFKINVSRGFLALFLATIHPSLGSLAVAICW